MTTLSVRRGKGEDFESGGTLSEKAGQKRPIDRWSGEHNKKPFIQHINTEV